MGTMLVKAAIILLVAIILPSQRDAIAVQGSAGQRDARRPCRAGFYCTGQDELERLCGGVEWYCPEGSIERLAVPSGYYSIGGTELPRTAIAACEPGSYW
jgi:hypothetical protein